MPRLAAFALALFVLLPSARADDEKSEQDVIKIGPKTTAITEPLDEDGFVDYVAAVNQRASKGVTAENNWEVVVRRVMGPQEIGEFLREEYHEALGIAVPPADGDYLRTFYDHAMEHYAGTDEERQEKWNATEEELGSRPWKAREFPVAAAWLKAEKTHVDALVEGSKRSRYYTPYLVGDEEEGEEYPKLIALLLPSVQQQRSIARVLQKRAFLHLGQGRLDDAWADVQALHRIAQHSARGFTMIEGLVGIAIDSLAFEVEAEILQSDKLTDAQLRRFAAEHARLPKLAGMAEKIDTGERWMALDAVSWLARDAGGLPALMKNLTLINALSQAMPAEQRAAFFVSVDDKPQPRPKEYTIDWNVTLVLLNGWYDRLTAAARVADPLKRRAAFDEIDQDLEQLRAEATDAKAILIRLASGKPRQEVGRVVGNLLASLLLPAVRAVRGAEDRALEKRGLLDVAFAAEAYRRRTGSFPKTLADLQPTELKTLPVDPSSGASYVYRRSEGGFVVYAFGRNNEDDGGRDRDDARAAGSDEDWDDVVLKVERR